MLEKYFNKKIGELCIQLAKYQNENRELKENNDYYRNEYQNVKIYSFNQFKELEKLQVENAFLKGKLDG